ncbi:hypothetical protein Cme02nite_69400 [Catellatospora methionotrophica]|uniref:Uncharacterized protein n=1 Tax=Catellatospora methionotrophica TaxID=121620 RepID=A0A8J3LCW6_9ACTN|nr:hypothetical protein [Catellatospora methionotrophica]GIG18608.1 hypothetical protein Cme02nite_69400 [Catellatospora methionotrophica]
MDKSKLLANRVEVATEDVEIPGVGTVHVRALSRFEVLLSQKKYPDDAMAQERFSLSTALLDPKLTEDEVGVWQRSSLPNEINAVSSVVNRLSGIGKDAAKSDVPGDGND